MIFNDERPALKQDTWDKKQPEIVVLQTMLAGNDKMIVEYMDREDYDEMFDGPRPQVDVEQLYRTVRKEVLDKLADDEEYKRQLRHYKIERGENFIEEDLDFTYEKDRSNMAEELVKLITKSVCTHLEASHIGTFEKMDRLY